MSCASRKKSQLFLNRRTILCCCFLVPTYFNNHHTSRKTNRNQKISRKLVPIHPHHNKCARSCLNQFYKLQCLLTMNPKLSRLSAILRGLQKMLVTLIKKLGQHFYIFFFWLLFDNAARPFASCVEEEFWAEIIWKETISFWFNLKL